MAEEWYYAQQGKQNGPVDAQALRTMLRAGQVSAADLVWRQGLPNWVEARTIPELEIDLAAAAPLPPRGVGKVPLPVHEMQYLNPHGAAVVYIGYIMAGFTERKQALHDLIANTLVVQKNLPVG